MLEFQEKRQLKKIIYSKVTLIILLLIILALSKAVWSVYKKHDMTKDNLSKVETSLESLQVREKMLSSEIERLKTASGKEEEIREKYGLIKQGEEMIVVVDDENNDNNGPVSTPISFWQKVLDWLK